MWLPQLRRYVFVYHTRTVSLSCFIGNSSFWRLFVLDMHTDQSDIANLDASKPSQESQSKKLLVHAEMRVVGAASRSSSVARRVPGAIQCLVFTGIYYVHQPNKQGPSNRFRN